MRQPINQRKRQKIFERDNFTCVNCGAKGDFNALEVDHIIPVSQNGTNEYSNLQTLCYKCNMDKRFGKDVKCVDLVKLNPLERLDLIKERLEKYKHLTYPEFKVVFSQDELFKKLRLDLTNIIDLFHEIAGKKKVVNESGTKFKAQRNKLLKIFSDTFGGTYRELEQYLKKEGFNMTYSGISRAIAEDSQKKSDFY